MPASIRGALRAAIDCLGTETILAMTELHSPSNQPPSPEVAFEIALARGALALLACAMLYLLLGLGVFRFWQPDTHALLRQLESITIVDLRLFRPELREKRLFLLVVFSAPVLILLLWRVLAVGRIARLISRYAGAIVVVATVLVVVVTIAAFAAANPMPQAAARSGSELGGFAAASRSNVGFYFFNTFVYNDFYLYALCLFPGCFWLLTNRRAQRFLGDHQRQIEIAILLGMAGLAAWMLPASTFRFPYTVENKYDFNAVFYPMVQVYHGAQLLTEHFTNTYGLYPQLLLPLFRLIGLSVATFSGTMAVLTVGCFGLLLLVLWRLIANRLLLIWTFAAVIFYVYCYSRTITAFDPYFANIPIRLVAPMTALGLALRYRRGTGRVPTVAALTLLGVGVLWCPDFGVMTYFAFTLFLGYLRIDPVQPRRTAFALGEVLLLSLVTLTGVFTGYALIMRLGYGVTPDLRLLFGTMKVFAALGMNMLPMPLIHPWHLVALTFAGGLLATLPPLLDGTQDERSALLFLLTILGIGAFSYYQGRSHNWNLLPVLLYVIPLWGICADRLLAHAAGNRRLFVPLAVLVFVLATSLPQLAHASRSLASLVEEREDYVAHLAVQQRMEASAAFIGRRTVPGEQVQIYTDPAWQGLYHGLTQRGSAFNPSYMDLFWRDDYVRFLNFLHKNATTKIYFDSNSRPAFPPALANPVMTLFTCCYAKVDSSGPMLELRKVDDWSCNACLERTGFDYSLLKFSGP